VTHSGVLLSDGGPSNFAEPGITYSPYPTFWTRLSGQIFHFCYVLSMPICQLAATHFGVLFSTSVVCVIYSVSRLFFLLQNGVPRRRRSSTLLPKAVRYTRVQCNHGVN